MSYVLFYEQGVEMWLIEKVKANYMYKFSWYFFYCILHTRYNFIDVKFLLKVFAKKKVNPLKYSLMKRKKIKNTAVLNSEWIKNRKNKRNE